MELLPGMLLFATNRGGQATHLISMENTAIVAVELAELNRAGEGHGRQRRSRI